jgi:hypothetical protein
VQRPKKVGNRNGKRVGMAAAPKNGNGNGNGYVNGGMTTILSAGAIIITLLQIFFGVVLTGINSNITRIEEQTTKHFATIENGFVRVQENREFKARIDGQLAKIEAGLKDIATRDEVNTRLGINSNSILQVRQEIDIMKRDFGQTYSIKDALKDLQDQIKALQNRPAQPKGSGG